MSRARTVIVDLDVVKETYNLPLVHSFFLKNNYKTVYYTKFRMCTAHAATSPQTLTEASLKLTVYCFYRAMLCIRGTSRRPVSVSVSVSVTIRSSTKTAKLRITQTTPHDSPWTLVF